MGRSDREPGVQLHSPVRPDGLNFQNVPSSPLRGCGATRDGRREEARRDCDYRGQVAEQCTLAFLIQNLSWYHLFGGTALHGGPLLIF